MLGRVLHITGAGALFTVLGADLDQVDHAAGGSERA
jgi:hypothetical protein